MALAANPPPMDLVYSYTAFFVAYLLGSLSFAVIVSKLMGLNDPRSYGSKNPGATNVLRSGNKKAAVATLLLDALKGFLPVLIVEHFAFELGFEDTTIAFVGVAALLGHLFPVFFRFQGGKGVATAAGVLLAFEPLLGLGVLLTWIVVAAAFRYSSLASVVAAVVAPFAVLMFFDRPIVAMAVAVMSLLLVWRHWRNIVKLLTGKESRIGEKADQSNPNSNLNPDSNANPRRKRRRRVRRLHDDVSPDTHPPHRSKGN